VGDREINDVFVLKSITALSAVAEKVYPGKEETVRISGMAGPDTKASEKKVIDLFSSRNHFH
jgi:hypothetical protein